MEIAVKFSPLGQQADSLSGYADALWRYADEVEQIRGRLSSSMRSRSNLSAALKTAAKNVEARAQAMSRMERGLREILPVYSGCETALAGGEGGRASEDSDEDNSSPVIIGSIIPGVVSPFVDPSILVDGVLLHPSDSASTTHSGEWLGYEFNEDHPGVTAWVGKASAEVKNESLYAGVNGYIGKAEAEVKAKAGFMQATKKTEYRDGEWVESEKMAFVAAEASAGVSLAAFAGDAEARAGDDMFGAEIKAEGTVGSAKAEAKGKLSVDEDGVTAVVKGEAMVSAVEGKASGTINILGFEIKGTVSGYAGAVGAKGKIGIEDNKFVIEGGVAALFGFSAGIEIGFNDEGWSNFVDFITFWD